MDVDVRMVDYLFVDDSLGANRAGCDQAGVGGGDPECVRLAVQAPQRAELEMTVHALVYALDPDLDGLQGQDVPPALVYGSVFPAVWSFQLALRARGLGTAPPYVANHVAVKEAEAVTALGRACTAFNEHGRGATAPPPMSLVATVCRKPR